MASSRKSGLVFPGPMRRYQFSDKIMISRKVVVVEYEDHIDICGTSLDLVQIAELRNALSYWIKNRYIKERADGK